MSDIYGFDAAWEGERDRLALAETVLDQVTVGHLLRLGVGAGWRCLEVGAGAGSIARWLCGAVGPAGRVVATDLDPRFVESLVAGRDAARGGGPDAGPDMGRLEVLRHDILTGPPAAESFDLAHIRLVLQHLRARHDAIGHVVESLLPGGWVLAEEFDFISSTPAAAPDAASVGVFAEVEAAIHELLAGTGFDPAMGRRLPGLLRRAGLVDVEASGALSVVPGGSPLAAWYGRSIEALRPKLVAAGLVSDAAVARAVADLADPAFELLTPALVSAWGRRSAGH